MSYRVTKGNVLISDCLDEAAKTDNCNNKTSKRILTAKANRFSTQINNSFLAIYDTHHNDVRPPIQIEIREGVTRTALISNRVLFKKMLKDPFRPHIISELEARGITPTEEELGNFNKLLTRLKVAEGNKQSFEPKTPFENFKWW